MQQSKGNKALGSVSTLLGGTFWGLSASCAQFLFTYKGVNANWLIPLRLAISGLLFLAVLIIKDGKKAFAIWKNKRHALKLLLFAILGLTGSQYTYFTTVQYSNAGVATVLQYVGPVLVMVYLCLRNKKAPRPVELTALCLSLLGAFLLSTHGDFTTLAIPPKALIWGLISAVTLLIYTVQPAELLAEYGAAPVIAWGLVIGGAALMPIFRPWEQAVHLDGEMLLAIGAIVIFGTIISFTLYLTGVKHIGPSNASMLACVEPVSATVISALWLHTKFALIDIFGLVFVITAVVLLSLPKRETRAE